MLAWNIIKDIKYWASVWSVEYLSVSNVMMLDG